MPKHDEQTTVPDLDTLTDAQANKVERIAMLLAEHLYAQPNMNNEDDENADNSEWQHTSEANKRIFRSCALEVYREYVS